MNFTVSGEGKDMILLHGWGCDNRLMQPLSSLFSQNYRVFCLDLFGFGKTAMIPIDTFEDYIDALHQFICEQEIQEPILLGHSFGGRVALFYALKYPVSACILTGSAGIRKPLSLEKKIRVFLHQKGYIQNKGSADYQNASEETKKLLVLAVNADISKHLSKIQVPTCLIWGEKDSETPLWMAKKMEKDLPNAILFVFEKEDHFAYYHETKRFFLIAEAFLKGVLV